MNEPNETAEPTDELLKGLLTEDAQDGDEEVEETDDDAAAKTQEKTDEQDDEEGDDAKSDDDEQKQGTDDDAKGEKPGTPDKALQQVQQDLAATTRKLDQLLTKAESGEGLTKAEEKEVQKQARKLDAIREKLTGKTFDAIDDSGLIGDSLVELDETVGATNKRLEAMEAELSQLRPLAQKAQADAAFGEMAEQYPGVNVRAFWNKAIADAQKLTGEQAGKAVATAANNLFHRRAAQEAGRVKAEKGGGGGADKAAANNKQESKPKREPAAGAATVNPKKSAVTPATQLTPDQAYTQRAMSLLMPANK